MFNKEFQQTREMVPGIHIEYGAMSKSQEKERLENSIKRIPWYIEKKYNQNLRFPDIPELQQLLIFNNDSDNSKVNQAVEEALDKVDEALLTLDQSQYSVTLKMFEDELDLTRKAFEGIKRLQDVLGFNLLTNYKVLFSRVGIGGSYNMDGQVIIAATDNGRFFTRTPVQTLIHEVTHIGIQHLVDRFEMNQIEKEVFVDALVAFSPIGKHLVNYDRQLNLAPEKYAQAASLDKQLQVVLEDGEFAEVFNVLSRWKEEKDKQSS